MVRVMAGLAAWAAGTVIAVSVAWLGANVVVRNAGVGPGMPVINAAVLPSAAPSPLVTPPLVTPPVVTPPAVPSSSVPPATAAPSGTALPGHPRAAHPAATARGTSSRGTSSGGPASSSGTASAAPSATDVHAYVLAGGRVTLDVTPGSVQLVTAVPDVGYSVQTWSGTDWLRVDFSLGAQTSSLIASWYEHAPTITTTN
jgi:hypothetical protein